MTDNLNLIEFFLTGITTYGTPALGLLLLLSTLGTPLPATLFVLVAGAFVRQGLLDWGSAIALSLLGVVLGDIAGYAIGRFAGGWGRRRFGQSTAWRMAQDGFERRGELAIYLTRFILTPLSAPVNIIAGGNGYPFRRFLTFGVAGELTRLLLYGGLGYAFSSQWELINQIISNFSSWLVVAVVLAVGIYFLARRWRQKKFSNQSGAKLAFWKSWQVKLGIS